MEAIRNHEQQISALIDYYQESGLLLVGLNDSQGVGRVSSLLKKELLELLKKELTSRNLKPEVIDAFSLLINKTEHIDYILKSNLNIQDIKLSQVYGTVASFEKRLEDLHLPKSLCALGYLYFLTNHPSKQDQNIYLTASLQEAIEPTVIYSSGVNNLMREIGSNPASIKHDFHRRHDKPNYGYTLVKTRDPHLLDGVMDGIQKNFENIYRVNPTADIYALGSYIPKSFQEQEFQLFKNLIIGYNERLKNLCEEYQVTFIDTINLGQKYILPQADFQLSKQGKQELLKLILDAMYQNKILNGKKNHIVMEPSMELSNQGICGMYAHAVDDYEMALNRSKTLYGYAKKREEAIAQEHLREAKVFQKALK